MLVEMKTNGETILIDTAKFHQTWLARVIEYGARRLVNDTYSGEKGQEKVNLCRAMVREMESGVEYAPTRAARGTKVDADPVLSLALKNAKAGLVAQFQKHAPDCRKIVDLLAHPKIGERVAAYFMAQTGDKAPTWKDSAVIQWMEQIKDHPDPSKRIDYMADAERLLGAADDESFDF